MEMHLVIELVLLTRGTEADIFNAICARARMQLIVKIPL